MKQTVSCLAAAFVLGPVAMAAAQDSTASLSRYQGVQARFEWKSQPGLVKKGTLVRAAGTSITFSVPDEGEVTMPAASLTRLDVYAGTKRRTWQGLVAGAALGIGLGFVAKVDDVECKDSYTTACSRGEALATYGGAGVLVGALVGTLIKSDRWTPVALGTLRRSAALGGPARTPLQLSVTIRF
jgi:hypothetical protein